MRRSGSHSSNISSSSSKRREKVREKEKSIFSLLKRLDSKKEKKKTKNKESTTTTTTTATIVESTEHTEPPSPTTREKGRTLQESSAPDLKVKFNMATSIPLSSFCVAAALAEDPSGKLIEYNELFSQLIVLEEEQPPQSEKGDETKEKEPEKEIKADIPSPVVAPKRLEDCSIWKLLGILPPETASSNGDNGAPPLIKQIYQGPKIPNRWVRIHHHKLDDSGQWLLQLEDIDVAERAKNQWTAILETSFDGFWDYHIPKDYEYMSPRFWEMFGYEPHEKQHKPSEWMDMVHPQDFKDSMVDLQQHFGSKGEIPYIRETRYKHKDGSWVWVLCRGKVIEWDGATGAPLRMIGTHTDITQSKLKALRERELYDKIEQEQKRIIAAKEELRKFVQHANAPVFGTDTNGIIDTWNDRMEEITKIPSDKVLGLKLQDSPVQDAQKMVQQALEGNESTSELLQIKLSDNTNSASGDSNILKLLINTTTRRNLTDGGVLGCVCFGLDLTEIQLAQGKLLRAEERFKAEKQLNEFVAHEVRNPLAAAISASGFIKDTLLQAKQQRLPDTEDVESMKEDIVIVVDSLEYIHQLLTSMLDLNKFLEKGVTLAPRTAMLRRDIVDPVYSLYKHRVNKLKLTTEVWWREEGLLQVATPGEDMEKDQSIRVDVVRLKQILINLISNSIKFTKEGFVRVQVGRFDSEHPDKLSILVEDSGPGIPKEKRKLLFQKYVQLSTQFQGSGIGLALTKQLVHAMNGSIEIDEHYQSGIPGIPGTRFVVHVTAPLVAEEDKKKPVPSRRRPQPSSSLPNKTPSPVLEEKKQVEVVVATDNSANNTIDKPAEAKMNSQIENGHSNKASSRTPVENGAPLNGNNIPRRASSLSSEVGDVVTLEETIENLHNQRDEQNSAMNMNSDEVDPSTVSSCSFRTTDLRVLVVDDDRVIRKLLTRRLKNIDKSMLVETAESGEIAIEKITGTNAQKYDLVLMDHFMPLCGGKLTGEETIRIIRPYVEGVIAGSSGNDMSKEHAEAGADLFWLKPVPKNDVMLDDLREAFKFTRISGGAR